MISSLSDLNKNKQKEKEDKNKQHFTGNIQSGQVVVDPDDDIEKIVKNAQNQKPAKDEKISITITLYANGFIVDQGPFRSYDDPKNKQFVDEIKEGNVPSEVRAQYPNGCAVGLNDKRQQTYTAPKVPVPNFSGSGVAMGQQVQAQALAVDLSAGGIMVDESKPVTQIQLRLHNGKTVTVDINKDDRVQTLFNHVRTVAPVNGQFQLLAGFPPKPLENLQATIEQADLLDSRVTQKLL